MKNKLKYLIFSSLKAKFKTKWFLVANIIISILLISITNIDSIIKSFGGEFDEDYNIVVIDELNSFEIFKSNLEANIISFGLNSDYNVVLSEKTLEEEKENIITSKDIIIKIDQDLENTLNAEIISKEYIDTLTYQGIITALNNTKIKIALDNSNINQNDLNNIYKTIEPLRTFLNEEVEQEGESMELFMSTVFPIFVLPFFFLSIMLIQFIGTEINTEKTTKGMEIIISNVSPKIHLLSKIIATNVFVLTQGLLLMFYAFVGLLLRHFMGGTIIPEEVLEQLKSLMSQMNETGALNEIFYLIPIILVLFIVTFVGYSLLSAILASMTTSQEDFQQMQVPLIFLSLGGYYLSIMAGLFKGALFIKILSYVPFVSVLLSPSLIFIGEATIIDIVISTLIMITTCYLLIKFGLRVYKVGILNYSSTGLWKKVINAAKQK